jgi:acetylornithine deacetylase/succinyl-diaminopimelate desuccinylase-like protein
MAILGLALLVLMPACVDVGRAAPQDSNQVPANHPAVQRALEYLRSTEAETLDNQASICEIAAPPFDEQERAEEYSRRLAELGLEDVRIDAEGNAIGERPGAGDGPTVVLSAHLDTVFPPGTDVTVTREEGLLSGPGIGDDCRGLTVVLAVARAMREVELETEGTVIFVGTVGEEGVGDLRGVKHLFNEELKDRVDYFMSIDGTGLHITHRAVGSHRYEVTFTGPGGHSYGAFGMPNPIHALGRAIAKMADFQVPRQPKVTFNVGLVEGGTSVNSIAYSTTMTVDMRSESVEELGEIDSRFRQAIQEALDEENGRWESDVELEYEIVSIGVRPAGQTPADSEIVKTALHVAEVLGFESRLGGGSTDSNIPISLGIPAITIGGGGRGHGGHSLHESFATTDSYLGTQRAFLLTVALSRLFEAADTTEVGPCIP